MTRPRAPSRLIRRRLLASTVLSSGATVTPRRAVRRLPTLAECYKVAAFDAANKLRR
jgi:hypothetical protein